MSYYLDQLQKKNLTLSREQQIAWKNMPGTHKIPSMKRTAAYAEQFKTLKEVMGEK